jgi:hypothetical protein
LGITSFLLATERFANYQNCKNISRYLEKGTTRIFIRKFLPKHLSFGSRSQNLFYRKKHDKTTKLKFKEQKTYFFNRENPG